ELARELFADRLRELTRLAQVGRRRLEPDEVRVRCGRPAARDRGIEPFSHAEEALRSPLPGQERLVGRIGIARQQGRAQRHGARHARPPGGPPERARRRCPAAATPSPRRWPPFFSEESWSSKCPPAAPASMKAFITSNAFSGPPKPASASATIGAIQ